MCERHSRNFRYRSLFGQAIQIFHVLASGRITIRPRTLFRHLKSNFQVHGIGLSTNFHNNAPTPYWKSWGLFTPWPWYELFHFAKAQYKSIQFFVFLKTEPLNILNQISQFCKIGPKYCMKLLHLLFSKFAHKFSISNHCHLML